MEQEASDNIFDIRLNQDAVKEVLKFARLAKWVFVLVIIVFVISIFDAVGNLIITSSVKSVSKSTAYYYRVYPFFIIIYFALATVQAYNYFKTGKSLEKAIRNNDETVFNRSFIYLYRNALFGVLTLFIGLAINGFRLLILLKYFYSR